MKNILIPSTLQTDTVSAVKNALCQANQRPCDIVLLLLSEGADSFSAPARLRQLRTELSSLQEDVLELCREIVSGHPTASLRVHTQYSISTPLLNNLIQNLNIGLVILTDSFKASALSSHRYCTQLLSNCRYPILHLGDHQLEQEFNKAMYLERSPSRLQVEDLQQLLNEQFSFRIVSQAKVYEGQDNTELRPLVSEAISKNNIDLLIETRKPKKIKLLKKDKTAQQESLGLPVLSLYEAIV